MRLYKFVDAISEGRQIDVCNHGKMSRDFTYVTDLVRGIRLLDDAGPVRPASLLRSLTGYSPDSDVRDGVRNLGAWFCDYYGK